MEQFTTEELVNELVKREGVEEVLADVEDTYNVLVSDPSFKSGTKSSGLGPARILVVID